MAGFWYQPDDLPPMSIAGGTSKLSDIYVSTREQMILVDNTIASTKAMERAYDNRIGSIFEATGVKIDNPMRRDMPSLYELDAQQSSGGENLFFTRQRLFNARLQKLAGDFPEQRGIIRPDSPIEKDAIDLAYAAQKRADDVARGSEGVSGFLAGLAGSMAGALRDPIQVYTLVAGGGPGAARTIGTRILATASREALINGVVEAAMQPAVQAWRKKIGVPFGLGEAARNVGFAVAFGAAFGAAGQTLAEGLRLGGKSLDAANRHVDEVTPEDAPLKVMQNDAPLAAKTMKPIREGLDAEARGAIDAIEADVLSKAPGKVDKDVHDAAMANALAHAEEPEIPLQKAPVEEPPKSVEEVVSKIREQPRGIDEPGGVDAVKQTDDILAGFETPGPAPGNETGQPPRPDRVLDTPPVMLDPAELKVDAKRFQFKQGGNAQGVTDRLSGIREWKPERSGIVVVWEDLQGNRFVADGHQRTGLAKRIAQDSKTAISLPGYIFREADGYSAKDVRMIAALKNIAEGSGSSIDAAKILRGGNASEIASLPQKSALVRDAAGLAQLSDDAFTMVVNDLVKPHIAALVGEMEKNRALHAQMLQVLKDLKPASVVEARSMISDMQKIKTASEVQDSLFGSEEVTRMLLKERAQVRAAALNKLKRDKTVFTMLTKEEGLVEDAGNVLDRDANAKRAETDAILIETIERLSNRKGPIADAFNLAVEAVASGKSARRAADGFVRSVRGEIDAAGGNGNPAGGTGQKSDQAIDPAKTEIPEGVTIDQDGNRSASVRPLDEVLDDADRQTDMADLLSSCKPGA